jgi:hypothetical protein
VRKSTFVVFALLLTLSLGLALQPDDGTQVSRPAGVGLKVDGANHAKPLPRIASVQDLLPMLSVSVALLVALAARPVWILRRHVDVSLAPRQAQARVFARRGPPAIA